MTSFNMPLEDIYKQHQKEKQEAIDTVLEEFNSYLKSLRGLINSQLPHKRETLEFIRDRIIDYSELVAKGLIDPFVAREVIIYIMKHAE